MHKYALHFAEMILENIVTQRSSTDSLAKLPKGRIELFLRSLVNLPAGNEAIDSLRLKFAEFLPDLPLDSEIAQLMLKYASLEKASIGKLFSPRQIAAHNQRRLVVSLSTAIKQAWAAPDAETRDWKMFILRRQLLSFYYAEDQWPPSPPPLTPLQQAVRYLQMEGRRARRCANSECPAPYFFATRRNQKFCGHDCAVPSRLEAKMRWWNDKGAKARKKRKSKHGAR